MKNLTCIFFFTLMYVTSTSAQSGVQYNSEFATNGYSLFTNFQGTFLVNNCGEIVNKWEVTNPENHCKLLENGNLLYSKNNTITELDWDGNIIKNLLVSQNGVRLDYEVIPMANGNYICAGRKPTDMSVFKSYGYQDPTSNFVQQDVVVEIDGNSGNIVWQWEILDHAIQDKDPNKLAYGVIKDHPRKLNINAIATFDWNEIESFMINGIDYNPELDEIALSVRKLSEVVIIDHSTTTEEAKGSTGGKHGHGGDAIYRYGNPNNYGRGKITDRKLYFQHNPNWIKYGPNKGKIMVYNNMLSSGKTYSSVDIFDPVKNSDGSYKLEGDASFEPKFPLVEYNQMTTNTTFYSGYTSGGKVLPNGNVLITVGRSAQLIEIDPEGKTVWEYNVPYSSYLFRSTRYAANYPAFDGRNLTPMETIEIPPSNYECTIVSNVDILPGININIYISGGELHVEGVIGDFDCSIFNVEGKVVQTNEGVVGNRIRLHQDLQNGVYIVHLRNDHNFSVKKIYINN